MSTQTIPPARTAAQFAAVARYCGPRHLPTTVVMIILLWCGACARAQSTVVADYRLTDAKALGAVQGPATLKNHVGTTHALARRGDPQYFNIPPNVDDGRALQFDGKHDAYVLKGGIPKPPGYFALEAWARATHADAKGLHGVVALGDGARGYSLMQQGDQWGAFVGGRGFTAIGQVTPGRWTHLAMVRGPKGSRLYLDGIEVGRFPDSTGITANFSVGDMGRGKEHFAGDIASVRLSAIGPMGFDLNKDLLIDQTKAQQVHRERLAQRKARLKAILRDIKPVAQLSVPRYSGDWLVRKPNTHSKFKVKLTDDGRSATLLLTNGLASRTFHLGDNLVCYSLRQGPANLEFLRSIKPEATIEIEGKRIVIGGMRFPTMASGHKGRGRSPYVANYFLKEWLDDLVGDPTAFVLKRVTTGRPLAWLNWRPEKAAGAHPWPPKGLHVSMEYAAPAALPEFNDLKVTVHYEIYDGVPVIGKWLSFANTGEKPVTIDRTLIEELAFADENANKVFVESEYTHFRATPVRWHVDPQFKTDSGPVYTERMSDYRLRYWSQQELADAPQSYYKPMNGHPEWQGEYRSRSLMTVQYPVGPGKTIAPDQSWSTFKSWLLLQDSMDEDRKGMARQALYQTLMPWTQENPIYMHVLRYDSKQFREAVDQAAACGFDMVILTFGSGFNMMSTDPGYIARVKADFDYARRKGIKAGGYILFSSSRSYGRGEHDVKPAAYGRSLCLGSAFGDRYFKQLIDFMKKTGAAVIETDGPYHGFGCDRADHPGHKGLADSYRVNWEQQAKFYRMCMDEGIFIISPDWYFASGNRKMPMGYKESNWTLPRKQQALVARQNIYDGTWWRTPSMSYHALPLTPVYGGGPESTMEPLSKHLDQYDRVLAQYFGMGIMAAYRGTRLYDTDETKAVVKGWVDFYHRHEPILLSPIVHVRRPDGRDLDCMMHVNANLKEKGLAFVWNPTDQTIDRDFKLPLYFTGITAAARISVHDSWREDGKAANYRLDREHNVTVPLTIPAQGYVWLLIEDAGTSAPREPAAFIEKLRAGRKQTIVTMGTSLTGGRWRWVEVFKQWIDKEYPGLVTIHNEGVGASASSKQLPGRSGLDVLPKVIAHRPDVVFIEFATNDAYTPYGISLAESRRNLNTIIDRILTANPDAEIILQTMNPVANLGPNQDWPATRPQLAAYCQMYRDVAHQRNLRIVDHYPNWLKLMNENRETFLKYVTDGVHPTLEGYRAVLLPEMQRTLLGQPATN